MNVGLYATTIQARVMREREDIEAAYDLFPDLSNFWSLIDLTASSNFRLAHGPKEGYVRAETFFAIVRQVITPYAEVRLIKEIGDAVLLTAPGFRPLFESLLLVDQVAYQMGAITGSGDYPFAIKGAIGHGAGKRLTRRYEDFVGTPIDQLARLMTHSSKAPLLLHEDAYRPARDIIDEYASIVTLSDPLLLSPKSSKGMIRQVYYREIVVDRNALKDFRKYFKYWQLHSSTQVE